MKTELCVVSPERAREWLTKNTDNRPIRHTHVETLRLSMLRGEFKTTHQGIAFDSDGVLLDGQHRLEAIAQMPPGFRCELLVTFGLDRDNTYMHVDAVQARRTVADVLGADKRVAEVGGFLARLYAANTPGVTPAYCAPFVDYVLTAHADLLRAHPRTCRTWGSAAVRSAACLCIITGDAAHTKRVYGGLVAAQFDKLPPIAQSALRGSITSNRGRVSREALFARAMVLFDPKKQDLSKAQVINLPDALERVRKLLHANVPGILTEQRQRQFLRAPAKRGTATQQSLT